MRKIIYLMTMALLGLVAGHVNAQTTYKCKRADGTVQFSDRPCKGGVVVRPTAQPDSPQRKAESDARIQRDKDLANQVEASRVAREQAGRAAQDQQQRVNQENANAVEQERAKQRANTISINPSNPVSERRN